MFQENEGWWAELGSDCPTEQLVPGSYLIYYSFFFVLHFWILIFFDVYDRWLIIVILVESVDDLLLVKAGFVFIWIIQPYLSPNSDSAPAAP